MSDSAEQKIYSDAEKAKIRNEILQALKEESAEIKVSDQKEVREIVKKTVEEKKERVPKAKSGATAVKDVAYVHALKTAAQETNTSVVVKKKRTGNVRRGIHVELPDKPKSLLIFRMMSIIFAVALIVFFIIFMVFGNLAARYGGLWQGK